MSSIRAENPSQSMPGNSGIDWNGLSPGKSTIARNSTVATSGCWRQLVGGRCQHLVGMAIDFRLAGQHIWHDQRRVFDQKFQRRMHINRGG
jgi:hypothetical protein